MDRRQEKTREAIFQALSDLLAIKAFSKITVQDIINEANIGRSTFYAHFETKDDLMDQLCNDMFSHVIMDRFSSEKTHDFSEAGSSLSERLAHLLWHIKDNERNVVAMLSGDASELFMVYFKSHLSSLFERYQPVSTTAAHNSEGELPRDLLLSHLAGSFAEIVRWWIRQDMALTPEQVIRYYYMLMQVPLD